MSEVEKILFLPVLYALLCLPGPACLVPGHGSLDGVIAKRAWASRIYRLGPACEISPIGPRNHLWMYDGRSLSELLHKVGFADTCVMPPGKTNITDPGQLDLEERADESVYVEAFQPV